MKIHSGTIIEIQHHYNFSGTAIAELNNKYIPAVVQNNVVHIYINFNTDIKTLRNITIRYNEGRFNKKFKLIDIVH